MLTKRSFKTRDEVEVTFEVDRSGRKVLVSNRPD